MTAEKFKVLLGAALFVVQASACRAQVPVRWFAESSRPTKQSVAVYQGETILLQPTMQSYGAPITNVISATLYWQTNNMEQAWWTKPAEIIDGQITAIFHPTNDFGAREYTFFIGSTAGLGTSYRAFGTLKMQSAPGHVPATLPAPELFPGLAAQLAPHLAPLLPVYDPLGSALAVSGSLSQAINNVRDLSLTNRTDKIWLTPSRYTTADGSMWEIVYENGFKCISATDAVLVGELWAPPGGIWPTSNADAEYINPGWPALFFSAVGGEAWWQIYAPVKFDEDYTVRADWDTTDVALFNQSKYKTMLLQRVDQTVTNYIGKLATPADITEATAGIRSKLSDFDGYIITNRTSILYGPSNALDYAGNLYAASNMVSRYIVTDCFRPENIGAIYERNATQIPWRDRYVRWNDARTAPAYGAPLYYLDYSIELGVWAAQEQYHNENLSYAAGRYAPEIILSNAVTQTLLYRLVRIDHPDLTLVDKLASERYVFDAVASVPRVPTNSVSGWLMYDPGSNFWLRVNVSNLSFTVHEVLP